MPTSLKNPYALTINGADSYTSAGTSIVYDGSAAATARLLQHSGTLGWASDGTISEFQVGSTYYTAKWKIPTPLSSINTSSDTYVNSTAVANYVAEAISTQTQAYVIDETSSVGANPSFAILNTSSTTSVSFTDDERILTVDEQSINFSGMHIGDVIYTKGANYKDWFLGSNSGGYVFYQIASDKPILTDYVKHSDVSVYNPTLS